MEDTEQSKLFVGGISWETTDVILKDHFGKYGTVLSSAVAKDRISGVPRGFAFITFSDSSAVDLALDDSHLILNRRVEVKKAIPRGQQQSQQHHNRGYSGAYTKTNYRGNDQFQTKKIFVGGLSANLNEEEFRRYFEKFGRITDVVVMHDNMTHRPRGFGFITFNTEESVEVVMQTNFHELNGKLVEVKRAVPKDGTFSSGNGYKRREIGGRSPSVNSYQQSGYPSYSPRFGIFPDLYGAGIYSGGYPTGFSYGFTPIPPRSHWSSGAIGVSGNFHPWTATPVYPGYLNGFSAGVMCSPNGYNGILVNGYDMKSAQLEIGHAQNLGKLTPSHSSTTTNKEDIYPSSGNGSIDVVRKLTLMGIDEATNSI